MSWILFIYRLSVSFMKKMGLQFPVAPQCYTLSKSTTLNLYFAA